MSHDSMLPPVDAIGGDEGMPVPTVPFNQAGPGIGREFQVDCRTQSEAMGVNDEVASDDIDQSGYQVMTQVGTIGAEKRNMGWEKNTAPVGAPPRPISTSGTRGAADIHEGGM